MPMPLKFFPNNGKNDLAVRLAVVYTLKHKEAVILQTCAGKRASDAAKRRNSLCLLPRLQSDSTEPIGEPTEERRTGGVEPLRLSEFLHDFSQQAEGRAMRAAETTAPTRLSLPSLPCIFAERPSRLFLSLSLPYYDLPLALMRSPHKKERHLRIRRAKWLLQELERNNVHATWEEMIKTFHAVWNVIVRAETSSLALLPPSLSLSSSFSSFCSVYSSVSTAPQEEEPRGLPHDTQSTPYLMDPGFVPCPLSSRRPRRCGLPPFLSADAAYRCDRVDSAFRAQENALQCRFHAMTRIPENTITISLPAVATGAVDAPVITDATEERERFELGRVVVPLVVRTGPANSVPQQKCRRRQCHADAQKMLRQQQQPPVLFMNYAPELRFPRGKHVRRTLTLRNTAKEHLQKVWGTHGPRHYRQRVLSKNFFTSVVPVARGRDLAAAILRPATMFSAAFCLKPPDGRGKKTRREDSHRPPTAPSLPLPPPTPSAAVFAAVTWRPLALEGEEEEGDDSGRTREDSVLCSLRVFSREMELQSFQQLQERRLGRLCEGTDVGDGDEWYEAAFLHDVQTMALPYREMDVFLDDARLHYCYRLALHRERRRLRL